MLLRQLIKRKTALCLAQILFRADLFICVNRVIIHDAQRMLMRHLQRKLANSPDNIASLKTEITDILGPYLYEKNRT